MSLSDLPSVVTGTCPPVFGVPLQVGGHLCGMDENITAYGCRYLTVLGLPLLIMRIFRKYQGNDTALHPILFIDYALKMHRW